MDCVRLLFAAPFALIGAGAFSIAHLILGERAERIIDDLFNEHEQR